MYKKIRVAIIGVSGYTGLALTKLLCAHPQAKIVALCSGAHAGKSLSEVHPAFYDQNLPILQNPKSLTWEDLDCVFTATPNGVATGLAAKAKAAKVRLIDLAADFRLKDSAQFNEWYAPLKAPSQEYLQEAVYGLTEFNRQAIKKATILANPGCYPTASALGIIPLLKAGLVQNSLCIIDAKSGTTGAGKKAEESLLYAEVAESFSAYKVDGHRHTPEIEQSLKIFAGQDLTLRFTPHLLPVKRGILATIYLQANKGVSKSQIQGCFAKAYQNEPFVKFVEEPPHTKHVYGTNRCHIYATLDERTGMVVVVSVIDNLLKGAAGQALQNFNLMFDLEETHGLDNLGLVP
jgi:N-acetyl-gamma-glutamyl-phosphate reductase